MAGTKVPIGELQAGMVLAQQLQDDRGRTIMDEGARLTPMLIKRLEKWGEESVLVASHGDDAGGQKEETDRSVLRAASSVERDRLRNVAAAVQERFSNIDDDPVMNVL